jgi:hypothetical protein
MGSHRSSRGSREIFRARVEANQRLPRQRRADLHAEPA